MTDTLESLRLKQGLTQQELAKKVGVTTPTVSGWETSKSRPYPKYFPLLAKALNTTTDNIFLLTNTKKLIKK